MDVSMMDKVIDRELGKPLKRHCLEGSADEEVLTAKKAKILEKINKDYEKVLPRGSHLHMLEYVHSKYPKLKETNRFHLAKQIKDVGGDLPFWKDTVLHQYDERFHLLTNPTQPEASSAGTGSSPGASSSTLAPSGAAPSARTGSSPGASSSTSAPSGASSSTSAPSRAVPLAGTGSSPGASSLTLAPSGAAPSAGTGSSPGASSSTSAPSGAAPSALSPIVSVTEADNNPKETFRQDSEDKDDGKDVTGILMLTLSASVQPWLTEYLDMIDNLATETQDHLTVEMSHLTILAQKALVVADINMELPINLLPKDLQQHLQDCQDNLAHDAVGSLFTQGHLQDLFYEFISVEQDRRDRQNTDNIISGTPHALWNTIAQAIKDGSDMSNILQAVEGYSKVMTVMIRKLAINIQNIWHGKTYAKLLNHLLKIVIAAQLKHEEDSKANLDLDDLCCDDGEDNVQGDEEDEGKEDDDDNDDDDIDMKPLASSDMDPLPMSTWKHRSKYLLPHPSVPQADGTHTEGVLDQVESGCHEPEQGDDDKDDVEKKRITSKHLSQLVHITWMLVESPELQFRINTSWLKNSDSSIIKQATLTDQEKKAIMST
ncbi:hypothetical protein BGZ74_003962, partial [Mortierella antarctica]